MRLGSLKFRGQKLIIHIKIFENIRAYVGSRIFHEHPNLDKPEPKKSSDPLAKITRKLEIRI